MTMTTLEYFLGNKEIKNTGVRLANSSLGRNNEINHTETYPRGCRKKFLRECLVSFYLVNKQRSIDWVTVKSFMQFDGHIPSTGWLV